nr:hypothetical protein [Mycobacterium shinjukuense]
MSWLLVAGIPGLLMLATLGLGRLERALAQENVAAAEVTEFLDQADALDVHTLAREGMPEALAYLHRRQALGLTRPSSTRARPGKHRAESSFADGPREPPRGGVSDPGSPAFRVQFAVQGDSTRRSCVALAGRTDWPTL